MVYPKFVEVYKDYLMAERELEDGVHYLFKFENQLGGSVVTGTYKFIIGTWEMVQIKWDTEEIRPELAWEFYYDADVVDGIVRGLNDEQVLEYLSKLKDLPPAET